MKCILGEKREMTQLFAEDGTVVPVTMVYAPGSVITAVKTKERDGYAAIQISSGEKREKLINKAQKGQFRDLGNFRYSREFRLYGQNTETYQVGDAIDVSTFEVGDIVDIAGVSKGKGFQGAVKRHGFSGGPRTHGHRHDQRRPGSIGSASVARVFPGMKMAGRMGFKRITVKNLRIAGIDKEKGILLVKGALPGRMGTLLEVIKRG